MKKKFFTLVLLLLFATLHAQEPPTFHVDSLLVNVDMTSLTTGVLYDRAMPYSRLDIFNDSINIANTSFFEQALHELYLASEEQKFMPYRTLRELYAPDSVTNLVDIAVLNAGFQKLNYNPSDELAGALRITDSIFETIPNGQPILLESHVFLVAPTKKFVVGNEIVFKIAANFIIEDTQTKSLVQLVGNFDAGDDRVLVQNGEIITEVITIPYMEEGDKILTFSAQFADGSSKITQSIIHLQLPAPPLDPLIENGSIWGNIPWQGFNESQAYYGKLDYRIFYHTNNGNTQKTLIKPLVIIDGFDPGDKRKIQDSDPHPAQSDAEHRSIEEMMYYRDPNNTMIPIIPILRNLGYDVVIVNHPYHWYNGFKMDGGADYIERNALTHVKLYQYLNNLISQNGSSEELVIVGPSMGGQISRYALAYMEKHGITHNTRLWVSIDSPHLGANIPMGVQSLLHIIGNGSVEAQDFIENQLGSAAARQQLIEQYSGENNDILNQNWMDGRTISQGFSQNKGRPIFINYYNHLFNNGLAGSHGYPQNLRKIAMINGALKYRNSFDNPFEINSTELSGIWTPDQLPGHGFQSLKIKGFTNIIGHSVTLESYTMPNTGNFHKIAHYKYRSPIWHYVESYVTNLNSRGNMDNTPGGWYPSQRDLARSIEYSGPCDPDFTFLCINNWSLETIEHVSSFIPTVSGLGLFNPEFNWSESLNRNLVCTNEIPFDSYYGPKKNEQHTSFSQESINWLLQELSGDPQPPSVYYDGSNLLGPDAICVNDIVTYEIDDCTPLPVQTWEVSNGLQIITSDDFSVTVQSNTSGRMAGFIKAYFPNQVVQKELWIGRPGAPAFLNGPEVVDTGAIVTYSGGTSEGATSYDWWLPYPYDIQNPFDINSPNWQVHPNAGRNTQVFTGNGGINGNVQLMGVNNCGNGDAAIIYVEHGQGGSGQQQAPVYPYPNTSVEAFNLDFTTYPSGNYEINIYDAYSNLMYQGSSSNIEKTISTLEMPNGNYFLHIHLDTEVLQYQLIINH